MGPDRAARIPLAILLILFVVTACCALWCEMMSATLLMR